MAKPDLDDGWFQLAYELLPALTMCCKRVEASIVLCEVLAQTYGRGKQAIATLKPAKIAERSGRQRQNIWRGIKELTDAGIIVRLGTGGYRFQKDYAKWRSDKEPLVDKPLAQYFAAFPSLAKSYREDCHQEVTESRVDSISENIHERNGEPRESSLDSLRESSLDSLHPYRENLEEEEEKGEPPTPVRESDSRSNTAVIPPLNASRPFQADPAALERLKDLIDGLDPHAYLRQKVQAISTLYPLDWIEAAFTRAAGQGDRTAPLANAMLIRWWQQGRMDEPIVFEPKASAVPPASPHSHQRTLTPKQAWEQDQLAKRKSYVPRTPEDPESP